jgi:hypothetical protein
VGAGRVVLVLLFVAAGVWFWDSPVLWPVKLLVVMVHETGHALASLAVGGSVDRVVISADEGGECLSRLPPSIFGQIAVYSAGYLGSALAGALLLVATLRFRLRRPVLALASAWLLVMAALYAGDAFTLLFCLGTAAVLAAAAKWLPEGAVDTVNLFLAGFCTLYAVLDLRDDLWDGAVRGRSDAALLADLTFVPAIAWAALWTGAALALLFLAVRWSVSAGRKGPDALGRRGAHPVIRP